ncbi:MAG: PKD domain-containing protein [Saprospiraceae bacterium]|nr:PKD domain-containing protein [Saprospiraceae bacterium]
MRPLQTKVVDGTDEHLKAYELLTLKVQEIVKQIDGTAGNIEYITLSTPKFKWTLQLFEYSFLTSKYKRFTGSSGAIKELERRNDFRSFKGFIKGNNQSKVSLFVADGFFKLMIEDTKETYFIEPLDMESLNANLPANEQFIAYKKSDLIEKNGHKCGVKNHDEHILKNNITESVSQALAARPCKPCGEIQVALAADYNMYRKYGGDYAATENQMVTVLADVQTVFDDEFENEYVVEPTGIFIYEDKAMDPFDQLTNLNAMLDKFAVEAPSIFSSSAYDLATLWTAKFGPLGEVGVGYQGSVCDPARCYSVCSDFWGPGGRQPDYLTLQAHQFGHNFNMVHDPFSGPTIMAPGLPHGQIWSFLSKDALNLFVREAMFLGNCISICPNSSAPVPEFSSDVTYGCQPVTVKFKDNSLNTTTWKWKFPGGVPDTSILQNPVVVYRTPGIYPVTLEAGNHRCEVLITKTDFIEINDIPRADFNWGIQGREVFFINLSERGVDYFWNFGDGEFSDEMNPFHVYYTDSTYEITLRVVNDCGENTIKKTLKIESIPTAEFEADTAGACAPGNIHFKDMSSPNAKTFQWDFPGGVPSVSTQRNPVVRYDLPGKYDVRLTVYSTRFNSSITKKEYVTIDSVPVAGFTQSVNVGQVSFTHNSRYAKSHLWIFGDNTTSTDSSPVHLYTEGTYDVIYVAINNCGRDTARTKITIGVVPTPAFVSNRQSGCAPYQVSFQNQSVAANDYVWYFPGGNPSTSTDPNPTVSYPTKGKYDVKLVAKNVFYSDSITKKDFIEVRSKPDVDFNVSIVGFKAFFTNQTIDGTNYIWDFGNGKASFTQNPEMDYGVEGEFNVRLISQNICGTDTVIKKVAVYLIPKVNFSANTIKGCPPLKVNFQDLSSVDVVQWDWQFESGIPATSTAKNPEVIFNQHGKYAVKLTVKNSNGTNALTRVQYIEVQSPIECPEHTTNTKSLLDDKIFQHPFQGGDLNKYARVSKNLHSRIYPNPASQEIYFETQASAQNPSRIEIFALDGKPIMQANIEQKLYRFDAGNLSEGSYLVKITSGTNSQMERLVIIK